VDRWTLATPPSNLRQEVRHGWITDTDAKPAVGDIWLLTWNNEFQALALLTSVYSDFVRAMPVTLGTAAASSDEAVLAPHILGSEATVWFHAETGLGQFLLHRRLISALSPAEIRAFRETAYGGLAPSFATGSGTEEDAEQERGRILDDFRRLCFIDWPTAEAGEAELDIDFLLRLGIDLPQFADISDLKTATAYEVWTGQRPVPAEVAARVARHLEVDESSLLSTPADAVVTLLQSTELKGLIAEIAEQLGEDERVVRNNARSSYALAARTNDITGREHGAIIEALNRQRERNEEE
jgi:hypothetical protein